MGDAIGVSETVKSEKIDLGAENIEKQFVITVPGSTSNLGPGFDALGLAVSLYNRVTFSLLKRDDKNVPLITLSPGTAALPADSSNHIYRVLSRHLSDDEDLLRRVRINIDCDIPVGSGLGSSGTASLAAVCAAQFLAHGKIDPRRALQEATKIEGHPDNVSPSLLGGFTVSGVAERGGKILVERLEWPEDWHLLFIVPPRQLLTSEARAVLPKTILFKHAVHNVQKVSLLLAAVVKRDEETMAHALDDRLHEPYRAAFVPELNDVRRLVRGTGAMGCVLSGAGPTLLVIVPKRSAGAVSETVYQWATSQTVAPKILNLSVDTQGLTIDE